MTVRLGRITLDAVQSLHTEESRTLVEQRVPEQQGSVFQDLGREPVTLVLEGLLLGEAALQTLEQLRQAQAKAEPLSFAADIAVGSELTDVVIEDFRARQVAGYEARFRFTLRLREHVEPPQPAATASTPVNQGVQADAAAWAGDNVAAAAVLEDPASLGEALAANPALLEQLDMDQLGGAVARNLDGLSADQVGGLLGAVGQLDPAKAHGLFESLQKAGSLGALMGKYLKEGASFIDKLRNIPLSSLMKAFAGGLEFLQKLQQVANDAGKLVSDIGALELPPGVKALVDKGRSS
ncbi:DNA circularization N-terminal domain-containing protein [Azohydromonas caseinilytica]|uniref:Uncharacterized protein n=1 Tax=Azohydromonas caseinilytica TaxID=2728836 RepID=A0A848F2Q2_9BURK|nr:DNA circularization N-terminal domain-containing protein [Azohydromonas caseinilytica]NML13682.1 hypothetical protein [Azohydromonas caseinilytica]